MPRWLNKETFFFGKQRSYTCTQRQTDFQGLRRLLKKSEDDVCNPPGRLMSYLPDISIIISLGVYQLLTVPVHLVFMT